MLIVATTTTREKCVQGWEIPISVMRYDRAGYQTIKSITSVVSARLVSEVARRPSHSPNCFQSFQLTTLLLNPSVISLGKYGTIFQPGFFLVFLPQILWHSLAYRWQMPVKHFSRFTRSFYCLQVSGKILKKIRRNSSDSDLKWDPGWRSKGQ